MLTRITTGLFLVLYGVNATDWYPIKPLLVGTVAIIAGLAWWLEPIVMRPKA